ncbi:MAG: multicopper oxidase family protein [Anaerolineae bacterium]
MFIALIGLIFAVALVGCATPMPPTPTPTATPTEEMTEEPTEEPMLTPTSTPTEEPMPEPTEEPPTEGPTLDAASIPKYVEPLLIPPVMEPEGRSDWEGEGEMATDYRIAVRQFEQQILPSDYPKTTVFGYGRMGDPLPGEGMDSTFNYPAFTIEARTNERVRVVWANQLVDDPEAEEPSYLPHLFPIDQTLHWANPVSGPDTHSENPEPYKGPVPIITHLHGAHVRSVSDGYPEAWYLPDAADIPEGYITQGSQYGTVQSAPEGEAVFEYSNDQRATTLWYHDHTMGMTRLNVYAGMAGFWLLRDDVEDGLDLPGPAPVAGDAPDTSYYEIPIVIQDRSFNEDGSLFYPASREFFDGFEGPYIPDSLVSPIWNPEFFGDTIVVNGRTWPYLEVEPRLYRFRLLNGSNSRFLVLEFDEDLTFHQIGSDGGLLPGAPAESGQLVLGPAERADVIVDFSNFEVGGEILMLNRGPDSPFGGLPAPEEEMANPETTGQVMQFRVVELTDQGNPGTIPTSLPDIERLEDAQVVRNLTLNEEVAQIADIPIEADLGTVEEGRLGWDEALTETPLQGDTEIWQLVNLTEDSHPIHLHLVMFQVIERLPFDKEAFTEDQTQYLLDPEEFAPPDPMDYVTGESIPPEPGEMGWKDTVIANPDQITRIIATFDLPGLYVWHCHILEHEDNEMMRPFFVERRE